ncbi:WRKY transcription factor 44 [Olea europaea subsp. europaea]|uniref:WRKY transcription factor 44 n=1 Tax=Olea europaea subsp. europaea TaxID=158383 RepID=A0A8S0TC67_OLEEU|nr:WRKY transcription factor 44 [Olea europaea subsp. europaea]
MEINEAGKIVIARPVASRPAFSGFRSFTELLCTTSSPNALSKTAVAAIKPRTVRFKPAGNQNLVEMDSFEAELSGSEDSSASDDILKSKITANVIYKPIAKLVSKTTISVLANLGRDNLACLQKIPEVEAQSNNQGNSPLDLTSESCQNFTSQSEAKGTATQENSRAGKNSVLLTTDGDRPSYDGYNWRKYGQKQVKGSQYPRSYYKCTKPNCPVKKNVERTLDGQIAEIVYKGVHNHPKSRPSKHTSTDGQGHGFASDATSNEMKNPVPSNQPNGRNECYEGRFDNRNDNESSGHSTYPGRVLLSKDLMIDGALNISVSTPDDSFGISEEFEVGSKDLEAEGDEPKSKRRKKEHQSIKEGTRDPQTANPNSADCEVLGDGYRWRKYGQKVVKGNPYPRLALIG